MTADYLFWDKLKQKSRRDGVPFLCLAPMADVTDTAFREMFAKYGRPDVTWTEFVSADGLASVGRKILQRDLEFIEAERPIVAQIFGSDPETIKTTVALCLELGFDGVDINMGCPADVIGKQGAGAALIKNKELAVSIVKAAQEAAGPMPVSVKTRIGYNQIEYKEWLPCLLALGLPALSLHLRTRKEMSAVPAHWELMEEIRDFVFSIAPETLLIGNGDIKTREEGMQKAKETGIDGAMIGRGVFGNPFFFSGEKTFESLALPERFTIMLEHTRLFEKKLGDIKNFSIMKKHYKAYVNGFDGAKDLRVKLMEASNSDEIELLLNEFLKENNI
jgi:nifR3 family TIM-barrel protein